jgi:hypothetical protein
MLHSKLTALSNLTKIGIVWSASGVIKPPAEGFWVPDRTGRTAVCGVTRMEITRMPLQRATHR